MLGWHNLHLHRIFQRCIENYLSDYTTYKDSTERKDFLTRAFDCYCRLEIHLYASVCKVYDDLTSLSIFTVKFTFIYLENAWLRCKWTRNGLWWRNYIFVQENSGLVWWCFTATTSWDLLVRVYNNIIQFTHSTNDASAGAMLTFGSPELYIFECMQN